jgi:hypothetical protein
LSARVGPADKWTVNITNMMINLVVWLC